MSSSVTLGIDIGGTKIESALVDASGTVQTRHRDPTDADQGAGQGVDDLAVVFIGTGIGGEL